MIKFTPKTGPVIAAFASVSKDGPEMRRALLAFSRVLKTRIQLGFRTGTAPSGAAWKPLKYRKGQPLKNTSLLLKSIDARPDGNAVRVGTPLKLPNNPNSLGAVHQFGMTITPKLAKFLRFAIPGQKGFVFARSVTIPARPFMPLDASGANVVLPPAWEKSALAAMAKALTKTAKVTT